MKQLNATAQDQCKIGLETETLSDLPIQQAGYVSVCTNRLRWVVDSINERYLQQAWVSETGKIQWHNIETVTSRDL